MHIVKVLSNLGTWEKIQRDFPIEFEEISNAINNVGIPDKLLKDLGDGTLRISRKLRDVGIQIIRNLGSVGWESKNFVFGKITDSGFSNINVVKSGIGLEALTGKFPFVESDIFVKFPMFIRSGIIELGVIVVLVKSLTPTGSGMSNFEMIRRRMREITPYVPKYPFVILGVSNKLSEIQFEELSTDLDLFLVENVGVTYSELRLQQERQNCDFKEVLPAQPERIAKEICAFANNPGGGVLLVGVDDNGNQTGISVAEKDGIQRRIGNIARDNCEPSVIVSFKPFEIDGNQERCLLAVRINEMKPRPCMSNGRIFIRNNATAVPANPDQVRQLLSGSLNR